MNWLAHAALSGSDPQVLAGNTLGDRIHGPIASLQLHPHIAAGATLHRVIDSTTDDHPTYRQLRTLFPKGTRRLAGILLDLGFDHVLSNQWERFMPQEAWGAFHRRARYAVASNRHLLPTAAKGPISGIVAWHALSSWRDYSGIEQSILRLCTRLRRPEWSISAASDLRNLIPELNQTFPSLWIDLQATSDHWRRSQGFV